MPLECHWLTQCTLGYHWATQRILAGYTGTPLEKLSWNGPHWNATKETLTFAAYTGTRLEGLWQPAQAPTHIVKHAQQHPCQFEMTLWRDTSKQWTGLCIFSTYLEFTALQWIPGVRCCFWLNLSSDLSLYKSCLNFWLKSEIRLKSETAPHPSSALNTCEYFNITLCVPLVWAPL